MPRRRILLLTVPLLLALAGGALWLSLTRDSLETAAMKIPLGMSKAEIHRILEPYRAEDAWVKKNIDERTVPTNRECTRRFEDTKSLGDMKSFENWFSAVTYCYLFFDSQDRLIGIHVYGTKTQWESVRDWLHDKLGL